MRIWAGNGGNCCGMRKVRRSRVYMLYFSDLSTWEQFVCHRFLSVLSIADQRHTQRAPAMHQTVQPFFWRGQMIWRILWFFFHFSDFTPPPPPTKGEEKVCDLCGGLEGNVMNGLGEPTRYPQPRVSCWPSKVMRANKYLIFGLK